MRKGKSADNRGYTLVELMTAMAITAAISAVAIPSYTRYIASAKETVCLYNKKTILYEYQLYCISEEVMPLTDYIDTFYAEAAGILCPSGGTYTAEGTGETAKLTCSVHRDVLAVPGAEPLPVRKL